MKPVLFYTVGYPGSGKTTLAHNLSTALNGLHLRGDKIGLELFRIPTYSPEERRAVYEEMGRRAGASLQGGRHILYDAATNTLAQRQEVVALAQKYGREAIGIWVRTPVELAKKRAGAARDVGIVGQVIRVIPPHIFDQYVATFETPQKHERIITVAGDAQFFLQYRRLQRQLTNYRISLTRLV